MKNRLEELQRRRAESGYSSGNGTPKNGRQRNPAEQNVPTISSAVEISIEECEDSGFMSEFLRRVDDVNHLIEELMVDIEDVKKLHALLLFNPDEREAKDARKEIDYMSDDVHRQSVKIRREIKALEQYHPEKSLSRQESAIKERIRYAQVSAISRRFMDCLSAYNQEQVDFREKSKSKIIRQLEITGKETNPTVVEEMLEKEDTQVFTQGIVAESAAAKQLLQDIELRHQDILKLEKSIRQLHDLFFDVAMLIESQGEAIDKIELNTENAKHEVQEATIQLKKAKRVKKSLRRTRIIWAVVIICLIAAIAVVIYFAVKN